jgi:hypothetical protein
LQGRRCRASTTNLANGVVTPIAPAAVPGHAGLPVKLALGALTLVNLALTGFGIMMAMMSPMMFDSGEQDKLLWAAFWSILAFPVVAALNVFLPWLFLLFKWPRIALVASAIPAAWLVIFLAVIFIHS